MQAGLSPPLHENAFLAALSASDFSIVQPLLTNVELHPGDRLLQYGHPVGHVTFPRSGLVALSVLLKNGDIHGSALVGRSSIIGGHAAAALIPTAYDAVVCIRGEAQQLSAGNYRALLDVSPSIRRLAAHFRSALLAQALQLASCNSAHPVEQRLCRVLLEIHDCSGYEGDIRLTQAELAQILGVRRTTVTLVAGQLETKGAIKSHRGGIAIRDRDLLEQQCCECFSMLKNIIRNLPDTRLHQMAR